MDPPLAKHQVMAMVVEFRSMRLTILHTQGNDSEVLCRPVAMFRDPFRRDPHK